MNETLVVVIAMFVIAGVPIIVIDALIIRKLRRSAATAVPPAPEERSIGE